MKQLITFGLLAITLTLGGMLSIMSKSEIAAAKHTTIGTQNNTLTAQHEYSIEGCNVTLRGGARNGRIRRTNSFQRLQFRMLKSTTEASRIKNATELEHQKFITEYARFVSNATFGQTYHLYNLRKLLI